MRDIYSKNADQSKLHAFWCFLFDSEISGRTLVQSFIIILEATTAVWSSAVSHYAFSPWHTSASLLKNNNSIKSMVVPRRLHLFIVVDSHTVCRLNRYAHNIFVISRHFGSYGARMRMPCACCTENIFIFDLIECDWRNGVACNERRRRRHNWELLKHFCISLFLAQDTRRRKDA